MKKLFGILLAVVMMFSVIAVVACTPDNPDGPQGEMKVAMITDYGDITDQSFNQSTWEACQEWCKANNAQVKYYKPADNSTADRVASVTKAIDDGYNTIVMPGYAFGETVAQVAGENPDVKFIALDVAADDFGKGYVIPANVTSFVYQEEYAGFMAGYAAVKEGYKKLGFLGGLGVPAVIRFGYGYVQGANAAAKEMNITKDVHIDYIYGGQFYGDSDITAVMETWYITKKVEVVFACGGGIYTSACEAATKEGVNGKVIGVDSNQRPVIDDKFGEGTCITSAMKGLQPTVKMILSAIKEGKWSQYSGKISNMGLVSGTEVESNYVQLPVDKWVMKNFTEANYRELVKNLFDKKAGFIVSGDTSVAPTVDITVEYHANIK